MRFRTPCSRRNVMFMASALNVVDITLMPAIPGTMTSRLSWLPPKIAPNSARKSRGRKKLKNAAEGLRQNIRRSRRYWCQARAVSLTGCRLLCLGLRLGALGHGLGGELEVDVLECRARDREVLEPFAAGERGARELVQERGRVLGLARGELAGLVAPRDAVARRPRAERGRRPLGDDPPLLDDRDAVAQGLRPVEVVRGQHDGLAEVLERAHDVPRRAPRRRVEAGGRLVEEDELGVADERGREERKRRGGARGGGGGRAGAARGPPAQRPRVRVVLLGQAGEPQDLVDV